MYTERRIFVIGENVSGLAQVQRIERFIFKRTYSETNIGRMINCSLLLICKSTEPLLKTQEGKTEKSERTSMRGKNCLLESKFSLDSI